MSCLADFGAGVWDLLASSPTARRQHQFISKVLGPVWEANHVWLIFLLVGLMNIFPTAFALFVPLMIALLGIVLRGAGFIFHTHTLRAEDLFTRLWSRVFSTSSLLTPFFLGAAAAAVARGQIRISGIQPLDTLSEWISPFSLAMGVMAVLQCATIVAVYLAAEARATGEDDFAASYRLKALFPGIITSVLGALCIALSITQAPWLWQGLLVLLALARRSYRLASLFVILQTAFMLTSWGVAQYPYIIPPAPTIEQAANAPQVIETLLIVMGIGMLIVVPAILYLFMVFKWSPAAVIAGSRPQEGPGTE